MGELDYKERLSECEIKVEEFILWCRSIRSQVLSENVAEAPPNASNDASDEDQLNQAESALAYASGFGV